MRRRKFMQWLAGAVAAIAIDPVLGGQAIWGTERPKLPKHVDVGVPHVPEPCLGPPGDRVWNAEALENLKAYHTLEEERRLEQALMEGMAKTIAQDHERAFVMSDYDYDPPCQNLHLVQKKLFEDKVAAELGLPREYVFPSEPATPKARAEVKRFLKRMKPSAELVERQELLAREIEELLASDGRGPSGLVRHSKTKLRKDYYGTVTIAELTKKV